METRSSAYPVSENPKPTVDDAPATTKEGVTSPLPRRPSKVSLLGPTQKGLVEKQRDPEQRPLGKLLLLIFALSIPVFAIVAMTTSTTFSMLPKLLWDVATLQRGPWCATDNAAGAAATVLALFPLIAIDYTLCKWLCPDAGSRWYLLHSIGNLFLAVLCLPDFANTFNNPPAALSLEYCRGLGPLGCTDWPTCIVIAMHLYHMLSFKLDSNDYFHHLLFVPTIGGINFVYPLGPLCNVLCFFISGLPGGVDYMLLAYVKMGKISAYTEKRINCSINTWVRGPGITTFCALTIACWARPYPGTPKDDVMPFYIFWPMIGIIFFNGQYYAQRVIGNYYIRKAQDYAKRGIVKVDLHAS